MKHIFLIFITGLFAAAVCGAGAFFGIYYLLFLLPFEINLDDERIFFISAYSFIAAVILAAFAGAAGGVRYGRKYK